MSKLSNTVFRAFFLPLAALLLPAVAPALPQGDSPATEPAVQTVADSVSVTVDRAMRPRMPGRRMKRPG